MLILGYIVLVFTTIQLFISIANLLFHQPFPKKHKQNKTLVSVLIPARNEENNIGNLLSDLKKQNYSNIEILVFNDHSTDKTANIVKTFADKDSRIKLINSEQLPEGWLGKNFACHSLAKISRGNYQLFLDADVRISGNIIADVLEKAQHQKLGLLSIFPKQKMFSMGEWISVPNMNFILLSLLPLILVNKSGKPSLAAANGQFMFFYSEKYKQYWPHERMKKEKVEDIQIARFYKENQIKVACLTGNKEITCRMYENFQDAVMGFSKNIIMFFGDNTVIAVLFWLITTFGFIPVWAGFSIPVLLAYLSAILFIRIFISIRSKQNPIVNLLLIIPQQFSMGLFIYKALQNSAKKQFEWKGRNIS